MDLRLCLNAGLPRTSCSTLGEPPSRCELRLFAGSTALLHVLCEKKGAQRRVCITAGAQQTGTAPTVIWESSTTPVSSPAGAL